MEDIVRDKRFAHIVKDPRFRKMPRKERKVKIDNRFKNMFTDEKFNMKCSVDKRGRPLKLSNNENLRRFYDVSDESSSESDSDADDDGDKDIAEERLGKVGEDDQSDSSGNESHDDDIEVKVDKKQKKKESERQSKVEISKKKEKDKKKNKKKSHNDFAVEDSEGIVQNAVKNNTKKNEGNDGKCVGKAKTLKEKKKMTEKKMKKRGNMDTDSSGSESSEDNSELLTKGELDFARGEAELSSSSDEEEGSGEDDELVHDWADLDKNVEQVQDATSRLAICNLDWDRIGSKDIFTALNSFKPNDGYIKSVKVYISEFGKERMAKESVEGPTELKALKHDDDNDDDIAHDDRAAKESFTENIRQYQFNRLRYYYGVVECDSVQTADHLYKECDGNEYETSCTKFDLRFIPEDMEFDEADMRSECTEMPHGYKPDHFKNYAMAFSKAELTWDETDRKRQALVDKQFTSTIEDLKDDDLKAYLADSSDEEEPDYTKLIEQSDSGSESEDGQMEEKQIDKYKRLLLELDNEEKDKTKGDVQLEIKWEMGLKETTEELIKKKAESSDKTVWDKYMDKKKEKKKERIKEKKKKNMETEMDNENVDQDGSFEAFSDDELPADIRDDPFFAEEMDPSNKSSKKEKGKKKKKKDKLRETTEEEENEKAALSLMMMDDDDNKKHFNLKKIIENDSQEGKKKKKKKKRKEEQEAKKKAEMADDFELDVQDPRFSAIYESHLYNIDPSAPEYKKTKGSEALVNEKLKRRSEPGSKKRSNKDTNTGSWKKMKMENSGRTKDESLASLVKSVKAKTKSFQSAKSHKER